MRQCGWNFVAIFSLIIGFSFSVLGQAAHSEDAHVNDHEHQNKLIFVKNNGQWEESFLYRAPLGGLNTLFLENDGFTYLFHNDKDTKELHNHGKDDTEQKNVRAHAYRVRFVGGQSAKIDGLQKRTTYQNYFVGNDPSKWAAKVPLFDKVNYQNIYEGIHLDAYSVDGYFKYDLIVRPGADPANIQLSYEGVDDLKIKRKNLVIKTSVDDIIEHEPYAYQLINGKEVKVNCQYTLDKEQRLGFTFPNGYNQQLELIIDPTVVAATLSGTTTSENFGHSATYDFEGNIYVGARSYGPGYPTTLGAFQNTFGGGETDIAISKYNPNGTQLIYATYIGGSSGDRPHSLITDFDQQLYIYGSSESGNYPTTDNSVQPNFGGETDIVVTVLSKDGGTLVGSTYLGGSASDGFNRSVINNNYGDEYRGEIMLDRQRNIYIASVSSSANFPTTAGSFNPSYNGAGTTGSMSSPPQDGVIIKLNNDLSDIYWSTFVGEAGSDTAMGLRLDDNNNVFVVGTAGSSAFPVTAGSVQPVFQGGATDAYLVKIAADGSSMLSGTFWGTIEEDHGFFLDYDQAGNIHIYGQTTGLMPITPGTYFANAGSKQFLASFNSDLSQNIYSTVIGNGPNSVGSSSFTDFDFVPVAFMVDKCDNIYFSGYSAAGGLPRTFDAISSAVGTFYLGILDPDATGLSYGTYYGNANHVDGGTSRFDKSGVVYQGVCSCTGNIMNTNADAWATNQETRCDIGVFKIDFDVPVVTAFATVLPASSGCVPFDANFFYTGKDATLFNWDFGNGQTSTQENPQMTFSEAGEYEVQLVASNNFTCNEKDTFYLQITVLDNISSRMDTVVCSDNPSVFINNTTTNARYSWNDGLTNATRTIVQEGVYWVDVSIPGCTRRDSFVIDFAPTFNFDLGDDISICDNGQGPIDATQSNIATYLWDDGSTDPIRIIDDEGSYNITVKNLEGCTDEDTISVSFGITPITEIGLPDTLCEGDTKVLSAPNLSGLTVNYSWNTGSNQSDITVSEAGTYTVSLENNGCFFFDSVAIQYTLFDLEFDQSDASCFGDCDGTGTALVTGDAGPWNYSWFDGNTSDSQVDLCAGLYPLTIIDQRNCVYDRTLLINEPDAVIYDYEIDNVTCHGDENGIISIVDVFGGTPPYSIRWDDSDFNNSTVYNNLSGGEYGLTLTDTNGCGDSIEVNVYEPTLVTVDAGEDQRIELGENTWIRGQVFPQEFQLIEWAVADSLDCITCLDNNVDPTTTTNYTLIVTDSISGCVIMDDVVIRVDKKRNLYIPNAFTPNGDGENDFFTPYAGLGVRRILDFKIFDRWGELIHRKSNFFPNDIKQVWNGTFRGEPMNSGVFVYVIGVEYIDNEQIQYSGDVTLLR